jgi:site-specific DNA-cytosine methylase
MKVLVACEFSGIVREAFNKQGHDATSCDLLETDMPGFHIKDDVLKHLHRKWDLMVAFPPCTHIAVSGARHFAEKQKDGRQQQGIDFFMKLANAPIPRIAIENPVGIMSSIWRQPDQVIQPYEFGENAKKTTCLWLKNLPKLKPTNIITPEIVTLTNGKKFSAWEYKISMNHDERSHLRSITFQGIADAMADQWGNYTPLQRELFV